MSRHQKALAKLCAKPQPTDFTWGDLCKALGGLGFKVINGTGSRRKFHHPGLGIIINCHEPHPNPIVPAYLIRQITETLNQHGFIA